MKLSALSLFSLFLSAAEVALMHYRNDRPKANREIVDFAGNHHPGLGATPNNWRNAVMSNVIPPQHGGQPRGRVRAVYQPWAGLLAQSFLQPRSFACYPFPSYGSAHLKLA